jgi:hypothetical protein
LFQDIAQTAVFIATKIEECPRRVRDILTVFHWLLQRRAGETSPQPLLTTTEVGAPWRREEFDT